MVRRVVSLGTLFAIVISTYQSAVLIAGLLRGHPVHGATGRRPRFAIMICARNESASIRGAVDNFRAQQYPDDCFDVFVVAHNCSDDTAAVAREAGVRVVVADDGLSGKAYAIGAGMKLLPPGVDYVGMFDADSRVEADFLETVPVASDDWLATGYGLGRRARNFMWWRPREALGLGVTISGTGWFVRPSVQAELGPRLETLTEDLELSTLMYCEGYTVRYTSDTCVSVEEPHTFDSSMHQRTRWVRGHILVVRRYWVALLGRGVRGNFRALDMAIYLVAPTRILTRTVVTLGVLMRLAGGGGALSWPLLEMGVASEFGVPALVGARTRLVALEPRRRTARGPSPAAELVVVPSRDLEPLYGPPSGLEGDAAKGIRLAHA